MKIIITMFFSIILVLTCKLIDYMIYIFGEFLGVKNRQIILLIDQKVRQLLELFKLRSLPYLKLYNFCLK